jgi:hypothetical protein
MSYQLELRLCWFYQQTKSAVIYLYECPIRQQIEAVIPALSTRDKPRTPLERFTRDPIFEPKLIESISDTSEARGGQAREREVSR